MDGPPSLTDHVLVLLFGWLLPLLSSLEGRRLLRDLAFSEPVRRRFYLSNSLTLALLGGAVLLAWGWQGRPFEHMGFRGFLPTSHTGTAMGLTALVLVLYLSDLGMGLRQARHQPEALRRMMERTPFLPRHPRELPGYVLMCACAGIFEEVIYRGFMVTYFLPEANGRQGSPLLALLVPALLFSMAHHYQGLVAMTKIFVLSVLLALVFVMGGSLGWVMAVHFGIDLAGGLATMGAARRSDEAGEEGG